jgi:hypothetical protein
MKWVSAVAAIAIAISSVPAQGWNSRGHMIVAAIAWDHLTAAKKRRVSQLIRLNPNYATWVNGVAAADRDRVAFMRAATWPDEIRTQHGYTDDGITPPHSPQATQNIGYTDMLLHRYWHFEDLAFSTDGTPVHEPESPNAENQIRAFTVALGAHGTSENVRSYDLVWLMHLVGDVHQPLHATARFSAATPNGDGGGNAVNVCDTSCHSLHSYWDGTLGPPGMPAPAEISEVAAVAVPAAQAQISDPRSWLVESAGLSRTQVYVSPVGPGRGPFTITDDYQRNARDISKQRMALAGVRLANLLNGTQF